MKVYFKSEVRSDVAADGVVIANIVGMMVENLVHEESHHQMVLEQTFCRLEVKVHVERHRLPFFQLTIVCPYKELTFCVVVVCFGVGMHRTVSRHVTYGPCLLVHVLLTGIEHTLCRD